MSKLTYNFPHVWGRDWHRTTAPADMLFREWEHFLTVIVDANYDIHLRILNNVTQPTAQPVMTFTRSQAYIISARTRFRSLMVENLWKS